MASFKIPSSPCLASALPLPTLCGAEILSLQASPIANLSSTIPGVAAVIPAFCNITVTYTHTGQDDTINVETWLPFQNYIGRLQAVGGGGWNAGRVPSSYVQAEMAVMQGYATMTTDAGLGWANDTARGPSAWALENSGQVNINLLQDLASVSLNDEAVIANDLINSFYGQPPDFSYWNGCSQGGRQGLMLAQRFPDVYDGILACAPAINWAELFPASIWPAVFMQLTSQFPHSCELDYLTNASVAACDGDDGVLDGIIADPDQCSFNPFSMVGQSFNCSQEGATMHLSHAAASVANATWGGPRSSTGEFLWYGPDMGADITGDTYGLGVGIAATTCSSNGTCVPAISDLYAPWIPLFIEKDPSFNQLNLTHEAYDSIFHASIQQYESIISTNDPDLSAFRDNDGKMITWHGLIDGIIPSKGTQRHYDAVSALMPDVQDFYRHFEAPGVAHVIGGPGGEPFTAFDVLRAWVENGTKPEMLPLTGSVTGSAGSGRSLCAYPKRSRFNGTCGDSARGECFSCE